MLHLPSRTVRLRLTLLYSGLFLVLGVALLATTYLIFRSNTGVDLIVPIGTAHRSIGPGALNDVRRMYAAAVQRDTHGLHEGLIQSGVALAVMTVVSIALGWLVAGRVLRPLRAMTATTRQISERNLNERLALSGPRDELRDLADTVDGLLARLEAHVGEQQRFAANASHELRTPLALTQTLLDVARHDQNRVNGELVDRLHEVNTRAINLTEALLLLCRADQRSFAREHVDLSLVADEATETLLPLADKRGVNIETSGEQTPTSGSHALLLQMTTNLVHNAIVHNLPEHGTVRVTASVHSGTVVLTVENTGEQLTPELVSTLAEPFQRGTARIRADHAGVGLGLAIVNSIAQAHHGTLTLTPRAAGGLCITVRLPPCRSLADDDQALPRAPREQWSWFERDARYVPAQPALALARADADRAPELDDQEKNALASPRFCSIRKRARWESGAQLCPHPAARYRVAPNGFVDSSAAGSLYDQFSGATPRIVAARSVALRVPCAP